MVSLIKPYCIILLRYIKQRCAVNGYCLTYRRSGRVKLEIKRCELQVDGDRCTKVRVGRELFRGAMKDRQQLSINVRSFSTYTVKVYNDITQLEYRTIKMHENFLTLIKFSDFSADHGFPCFWVRLSPCTSHIGNLNSSFEFRYVWYKRR